MITISSVTIGSLPPIPSPTLTELTQTRKCTPKSNQTKLHHTTRSDQEKRHLQTAHQSPTQTKISNLKNSEAKARKKKQIPKERERTPDPEKPIGLPAKSSWWGKSSQPLLPSLPCMKGKKKTQPFCSVSCIPSRVRLARLRRERKAYSRRGMMSAGYER
jgi:hypothetical protein